MEFVRARDLDAGTLIIGEQAVASERGAEVSRRTEFGLIAAINHSKQTNKYVLWLGGSEEKLLAAEDILNQEVFNTEECPVIVANPYDLRTVGHLDNLVRDDCNCPIMKGEAVYLYLPRQREGLIADREQFLLFSLHGSLVRTETLLNSGPFGAIDNWTIRPGEQAGLEVEYEYLKISARG